jgi:predicted neuraminidase
MIFNASSAADATQRRESLYDELGDSSATPAKAAAGERRAFWGAPRAPMTLALSADDGLSWPWQRNLEVGDGWCMSNDSERGRNREYSYPPSARAPTARCIWPIPCSASISAMCACSRTG